MQKFRYNSLFTVFAVIMNTQEQLLPVMSLTLQKIDF